ncbi:hypothetical protein QR680_008801 [Steinernema hermaphroditum]|uniref:Pyridoxal kinase n=1 Tax=Steinernema hermaphroditum TaxID=289476 RepID=A0AA39IJE5_9BILA|nr:hypothetical protein QR680_008801 [Steinernema hermaphroditum]
MLYSQMQPAFTIYRNLYNTPTHFAVSLICSTLMPPPHTSSAAVIDAEGHLNSPRDSGMSFCENGVLEATTLEALRRHQGDKTRVLSIQSHVVSGYCGNKSAIFPLQLHGFDVDFVNSVQFSNHTAYEHIRGQRLTETELAELYEGLKLNHIDHYSHVLTGYCGNPTFLRKIIDIVTDLKMKNPDLLFVCDPVLGDNGEYYTPKELMPIYRDEVIPLADVLTPNAFELQEITGLKVENEADCLEAIRALHRKGVKIVVVTSGMFDSPEKKIMHCYASLKQGEDAFTQHRFEIPVLQGRFVGTGDVFASLLIVWLHIYKNDIPKAVSNVISSIQSLLRRTIKHAYGDKSPEEFTPTAAQAELQLIQSRVDLLAPSISINYVKLP